MEESTIDLGKSIDEIEAPILMPEEWYNFEIVTPKPEVKPNVAMGEDPNSEKAGHNWVIHLRSHSDEAEFSGRRFTLWLSVPKPADEEKYTSKGQKVYDAKMSNIIGFAEAFGGKIDDRNVSVQVGGRGQAYVLQRIGQDGEPENTIDIFNSGFRKADDDEFFGGKTSDSDDEIPF